MKNKEMNEVSAYKMKKIFKVVLIVAIIILILEAIAFLILKNNRNKSLSFYEDFESITVLKNNDYLVTGSSDFKESKKYSYTGGYQKALLKVIDKSGNDKLEVQYDRGNNSIFTKAIEVEDGYLVIGSCEYTDYQTENKIRTAIILKYNTNGEKVWEHSYEVRSDTRFNNMILTSDNNIIVIGQSIYEAMELGNHTDGGGIIVKYDMEGNEIWHNNLGGNKSGNFNGLKEINGDIFVVGKDASDTGNIIKYDKNGEYKWHKNYSYTDTYGFQDIETDGKFLYVIGSKKILSEEILKNEKAARDTKNTDLVIVKYDFDGNLKKEVLYGGTSYERGLKIEYIDNQFYIFGMSSSSDAELKIKTDEKYNLGSMIMLTYDNELEYKDGTTIGGKYNDIFSDVVYNDEKFYIVGYSNSNDGDFKLKNNKGKNYLGKLVEITKDYKKEIIK